MTTVIEIDPVIPKFAKRYFALPEAVTVLVADAMSFVPNLLATKRRFDYIVHDVFTGGAEPLGLFTLEFLSGLKRLLRKDGVIAIVSLLFLTQTTASLP